MKKIMQIVGVWLVILGGALAIGCSQQSQASSAPSGNITRIAHSDYANVYRVCDKGNAVYIYSATREHVGGIAVVGAADTVVCDE